MASNVFVIPAYFAESLAAVGAALAGLNYDFASRAGLNRPPTLYTNWGPVFAALIIGGLALRLRRANIPPLLGALAVLAAYWVSGALVLDPPPGFRSPGLSRYLYPSAPCSWSQSSRHRKRVSPAPCCSCCSPASRSPFPQTSRISEEARSTFGSTPTSHAPSSPPWSSPGHTGSTISLPPPTRPTSAPCSSFSRLVTTSMESTRMAPSHFPFPSSCSREMTPVTARMSSSRLRWT